jgi:hypothetical protein
MNSLFPIKQEPTGAPGRGRLSASGVYFDIRSQLTESLAEAGTDGVERFTKHVEGHASLYGNVPDARTIKVQFDAALTRVLRDTNYFVLRKDQSIKRILQRYHFSAATTTGLSRDNKIREVAYKWTSSSRTMNF